MKTPHCLEKFHQLPRAVVIGAYFALGLAAIGIGMRAVDYIKLYFATQKQCTLPVAAIKAMQDTQGEDIVLPGNVVAWHDAPIYARTNGYVIRWLVDYGSRVKAGDLLAEIATPELDASLKQAEADLKTAEANTILAQITAKRWQTLLKTDSVSKQETAEKVLGLKAQEALEVAARANRDRLRALAGFERVIAPFDGIIMSRTTDIGRLINAGHGTIPLFRLVQENYLRVYVQVPQEYIPRINDKLIAKLYFREHPGKLYPARVLNTGKAIDAKSRSMTLQLEVDNPNYELLAGSYAQVHLSVPADKSVIQLPVNTLIFRAQGLQVAIVDGEDKVQLKSITLGRDFGDKVEVVAGLQPGERVILNPPDFLISGQKVCVTSLADKLS